MNKGLKIFNIVSAVLLILFGAFYAIMSSVYFTTSNAPLMIIGVVSVLFSAGLMRSQLKSDGETTQIVDGEKISVEPGKWSPFLSLIVFSAHIFMLPNIIIATTDAPFYIYICCYCTTALSAILIVTTLIKQKKSGTAKSLKKRIIIITVITLLVIAASAGKFALFAGTQQNIDNAESAANYTKNLSPTELSEDLPAAETIRNEITSALGTTVYYALEQRTEQKTDSFGKNYTELIYYVWTAEDINISEYTYKLYEDGTAKFGFARQIEGANAGDFANSPYFTWEYSENSTQE